MDYVKCLAAIPYYALETLDLPCLLTSSVSWVWEIRFSICETFSFSALSFTEPTAFALLSLNTKLSFTVWPRDTKTVVTLDSCLSSVTLILHKICVEVLPLSSVPQVLSPSPFFCFGKEYITFTRFDEPVACPSFHKFWINISGA